MCHEKIYLFEGKASDGFLSKPLAGASVTCDCDHMATGSLYLLDFTILRYETLIWCGMGGGL